MSEGAENDMPAQGRSIIRSLYLYAFALVGLIMVAIGGVRLADLALRALIFTEAEQQERVFARQPPPVPARLPAGGEPAELTPEEREQMRVWLREYEEWRALSEGVDPIRARRHRDAASGLALILIGLPIYFYHWRLIRLEPTSQPPDVVPPRAAS
jgi:hypothetical protein